MTLSRPTARAASRSWVRQAEQRAHVGVDAQRAELGERRVVGPAVGREHRTGRRVDRPLVLGAPATGVGLRHGPGAGLVRRRADLQRPAQARRARGADDLVDGDARGQVGAGRGRGAVVVRVARHGAATRRGERRVELGAAGVRRGQQGREVRAGETRPGQPGEAHEQQADREPQPGARVPRAGAPHDPQPACGDLGGEAAHRPEVEVAVQVVEPGGQRGGAEPGGQRTAHLTAVGVDEDGALVLLAELGDPTGPRGWWPPGRRPPRRRRSRPPGGPRAPRPPAPSAAGPRHPPPRRAARGRRPGRRAAG